LILANYFSPAGGDVTGIVKGGVSDVIAAVNNVTYSSYVVTFITRDTMRNRMSCHVNRRIITPVICL